MAKEEYEKLTVDFKKPGAESKGNLKKGDEEYELILSAVYLPQTKSGHWLKNFEQLEEFLQHCSEEVATCVKNIIDRFDSFRFRNHQEKGEFAKKLQGMLIACHRRIVCPKCGRLGNLRFDISMKYPDGVFDIDHPGKGKRESCRIGTSLKGLTIMGTDVHVVPKSISTKKTSKST